MIRHQLTTPMFLRMELRDELITSNFRERGLVTTGYPATELGFAMRVRHQLLALASLASTAEEGDAITVTPGVFGLAYAKHDTLRSSRDICDARARFEGVDYAMFDVYESWLTGAGPSIVVTDEPTADTCPLSAAPASAFTTSRG